MSDDPREAQRKVSPNFPHWHLTLAKGIAQLFAASISLHIIFWLLLIFNFLGIQYREAALLASKFFSELADIFDQASPAPVQGKHISSHEGLSGFSDILL